MEDKPRINVRKAVPGCRGERLRLARLFKANDFNIGLRG
jgi:hypothetical protein